MNSLANSRGAPVAIPLAIMLAGGLAACAAEDEPAETAPVAVAAPATPAGELVARSIQFHDPDGVWGAEGIAMRWVGTNPAGEERVAVDLSFGSDAAEFTLSGRYAGATMEYRTSSEGWSATVDGVPEPELSDEVRERVRLHREDGWFWRSYYAFLAGLPMKILDPGAHPEPDIIETTFRGRPVHAVRVTYDPEVGTDIWYFYFDPDTAQLIGCRFRRDESIEDGEYITFEGLTEGGGLRLPRYRSWYMNADDRFLATDEIRSIEVRP